MPVLMGTSNFLESGFGEATMARRKSDERWDVLVPSPESPSSSIRKNRTSFLSSEEHYPVATASRLGRSNSTDSIALLKPLRSRSPSPPRSSQRNSHPCDSVPGLNSYCSSSTKRQQATDTVVLLSRSNSTDSIVLKPVRSTSPPDSSSNRSGSPTDSSQELESSLLSILNDSLDLIDFLANSGEDTDTVTVPTLEQSTQTICTNQSPLCFEDSFKDSEKIRAASPSVDQLEASFRRLSRAASIPLVASSSTEDSCNNIIEEANKSPEDEIQRQGRLKVMATLPPAQLFQQNEKNIQRSLTISNAFVASSSLQRPVPKRRNSIQKYKASSSSAASMFAAKQEATTAASSSDTPSSTPDDNNIPSKHSRKSRTRRRMLKKIELPDPIEGKFVQVMRSTTPPSIPRRRSSGDHRPPRRRRSFSGPTNESSK